MHDRLNFVVKRTGISNPTGKDAFQLQNLKSINCSEILTKKQKTSQFAYVLKILSFWGY